MASHLCVKGSVPRKPIASDRKKLRAAAEARFARTPQARATRAPASPLLHELQVHQIELEMQNDELRRDQLELQAAHARIVDLCDFAPVGYLTLDAKGTITSANLTAAGLLGKERKRLVGRRFAGFIRETDANRWHLFFSALVETDERRAHRLALKREDGSNFEAHLACERRTEAEAGPQIRIVLTDVTEFARAEQALHETKERLSYVIDGSNDGFWDWNVPGGGVKFSRRWAQMFGYDLDDLEPTISTCERMSNAGDHAKAEPTIRACLQGRTDHFQSEERVRHRDGRWIWCLIRGKVVERNAAGNAVRVTGTFTDITERKQAEEALRRSEARFRTLAEGLPVGIFEADSDGRNVYINPAGGKILGLSPGEVRGAGWQKAVHPEDRERVAQEWRDAVAAGEVFSSRYRYQRPDGSVVVAQGYGTAIRDPAGGITGFIGALMDVTAQEVLERRLALTTRLAAMGTLVAGLAHEINNPLAAELSGQGVALEIARGFRSQSRQGGSRDTDQRTGQLDEAIEALEDAQEGGLRVARIVRDMAMLAHPDLPRFSVRLRDAVDEGLRSLPAAVSEAARITVEELAEPYVLAATGQVAQVVANLVSNAVKATEAGKAAEIVVRIRAGEAGEAILEVVDHGIGMGPQVLDRIFDPFFTSRPVGEGRGSGLGLSICKAIVDAHGGTLTVESEVGKGSTFRVELPAAPAAA